MHDSSVFPESYSLKNVKLNIDFMRKSYVTPSILLLPMQVVGPNAAVSPDSDDSGNMDDHKINAKEGGFDEDFDMNAGWFD